MTDRQYIKQMIVLTEQLERWANEEPFNKAAWQCALDEFHYCNCLWSKTRRRRSWLATALIVFLWILLFLLVADVLSWF